MLSGRPGLPNTTAWKASRGSGKARMDRKAKPPWQRSASDRIPRTGEKNGRKRSLLTDGSGVPLAIAVSGANTHDSKLLEPTLSSVVIERPATKQHLCLDAGYVGPACLRIVQAAGYEPHIRPRGEEAKEKTEGKPPRRWVVERTHSWLNRWRKLLVSFEKTQASFEGLLKLACGLIAWRQSIVIYG